LHTCTLLLLLLELVVDAAGTSGIADLESTSSSPLSSSQPEKSVPKDTDGLTHAPAHHASCSIGNAVSSQ